eukprot:scaffold249884_cov26-Tisochrysis_lutea.AAC.5
MAVPSPPLPIRPQAVCSPFEASRGWRVKLRAFILLRAFLPINSVSSLEWLKSGRLENAPATARRPSVPDPVDANRGGTGTIFDMSAKPFFFLSCDVPPATAVAAEAAMDDEAAIAAEMAAVGEVCPMSFSELSGKC